MTIKFSLILLSTAITGVCGWKEFGLRARINGQPLTNRMRRKSSIWDEVGQRRQRIYRIREDLEFEESLQYESFIEMASFSMSMPMIPSSGPTASPVHSEPPPLVIPTAAPSMLVPSSVPTKIPTEAPSDVPSTSPAHAGPPSLVIPTASPVVAIPSSEPTKIPTAVPSEEPIMSPVHTEPPPLVIPTQVPSDEPTGLQPGASQSPTIDIAPTASLVPTTIQGQVTSMEPTVSAEPSATLIPSGAPTTTAPTTSQAPTFLPSASPSKYPSISSSPTESGRPSASANPSSRPSAPPVPTLSPSTVPSQKPSVSMFPTQSQHPSSSGMPSGRPSESSAPTATASPTALDPSSLSTFEPSSQSQVAPTFAFDCLDNNILSLGEASDANTTLIDLVVGYHVESSSNSTDDFLAELEQSLLLTAVAAALGCNRPDLRRRHLMESFNRKLLKESTIIDSVPCNTTVEGAVSCTTIETDLIFFLKGEVDPDTAKFSGYSAIRDKMTNDEYIGVISTVLKLIYKSPLPLPAPPQANEDQGSNNDGNNSGLNARNIRLQVSPWTIGACVASVFGGAVSLLVWSRNRRSRHHRHVQLVEDCSMVDSSTSSRNPVSV